MMTTGYDCPDLLNLGFGRPVKSPTDYIQMKGRGTRIYDFTQNFTDQLIRNQIGPRPKDQFRIIDYFGVCEHFAESELYDNVLIAPTDGTGEGADPKPAMQPYIQHGEDHTESVVELTMAADNRITSRQEILGQQEADNIALADAFKQYLELHPIENSYHQGDAQRLFEAYATDEPTRQAIDKKEYGALGGVINIHQYTRVLQEHRETIPHYIREQGLIQENN